MKKHIGFIALICIMLAALVNTSYGLFSANEIRYLSPRPNAKFVPLGATIIINYGEPVENSGSRDKITVYGEKSGFHTGSTVIANDGQTIIFTPDAPFLPNEIVSVQIDSGIVSKSGNRLLGKAFTFTTTSNQQPERYRSILEEVRLQRLLPQQPHKSVEKLDGPAVTAGFKTLPVDYPPITVTVPANNTAEGSLFLSNFSINWTLGNFNSSRPHLLILDDSGEPIFYRRMPGALPALDFKKQPNGLLTYGVWNDIYYVMDETYTVVDSYTAGNGYPTIDLHDLQILPNGNALIMIYDPQPVDMSAIVAGGDPNAVVIGLVIQELDTNKNVVFEWRSWDHIPITDGDVDLTASVVDYVHGNSVELDSDGNILISSRAINEVTKIDRQTGDIIWRMGSGKGNEFTFDEPDPFLQQHDARRLPNGNITIFDNHLAPNSTYARGVEYEVDEVNKTAKRVWEYRSTGTSLAMGNAQRLPNGNTLMGWGSKYPTLTEVHPDNSIAVEMQFLPHDDPAIIRNSYRVLRSPWTGAPTGSPRLVVESNEIDQATLYFSWNGATDVASYQIFAGHQLDSLAPIGTADKMGFETEFAVANADSYCLFQVAPVLQDGSAGVRSPAILADRCKNTRLFMPFVRN